MISPLRLLIVVCFMSALSVGCGDDDDGMLDAATFDMPDMVTASDEGIPDADVDLGVDAAPPSECLSGSPLLEPLSGAPGFAVVSSDFTSTGVGILDSAGSTVLASRWIDSSTASAGLVAALSGDVVLPSGATSGLVLIDRGNDTITRVCVPSGSLIGQVRIGTDEVFSNPQDWLELSPAVAWVPRYEPHPNAADEADRGSDLIRIDPTTMTRLSGRIDLSEAGGVVTGLDGDGNEVDVAIAARPERIARIGELAVVGLERLPVDFFGARGHLVGAVAAVDVTTSEVAIVALPGLANCGSVATSPSGEKVIVACEGYSNVAFGDSEGERANAGFATLAEVDGELVIESSWRVADGEDRRASVHSMVVIDDARVAAVEWGSFGASGDTLVVTDLRDGAQTELRAASDAFAIGEGARNGDVLLVPDASMESASVWRFDVTADAIDYRDSLTVDSVLPPRIVRSLR